METQQHRQIALYATHQEAMRDLLRLQQAGLSGFRLRLIEGDRGTRSLPRRDNSGLIFDLLVRGASQGALTGGLIGIGFVLLLASAGTASLSAASYLLLVLSVAGLAGIGGALFNAGAHLLGIDQRIRRALDQGHVVLLVHPGNDDEALRVQRLIRPAATLPWSARN